jgi:glutathione S-transferase
MIVKYPFKVRHYIIRLHAICQLQARRGETMRKIYGWKRSRTIRCLWVLEELGLEYEHIALNPNLGETRTAEYLALNPSGKIPTLVEEDFVLTETIAINAYLASGHPGALWPREPCAVAKLNQWTSWAVTELEPPVVAIFREGRRAADQIDRARIEAWAAEITKMLGTVLEPHLARHAYVLAGADFTLADLNLAALVGNVKSFNLLPSGMQHIERWLERCLARPAWRRIQEPA